MKHDITEPQHRLLKQLAGFPEGATRGQLKKPDAKVVASLLGRFVEEQKPPKGRSKLLRLTDAGREWIAEHAEFVRPKPPYPAKLRLFMMELMLRGGGASSKELEAPGTKECKPLIDAKLLEEAKAGQSRRFMLTDAGWKWIEDHLTEPYEKPGPSGRVLHGLLVKLQAFLSTRSLRLADFVRAQPQYQSAGETLKDAQSEQDVQKDGIETAIRSASLALGGGKDRQGLRLADVRAKLARFDRADQDRALLELARSGRLVLYGMDDPQEMKPDDRAAELRTPGGEPRHIIYWIEK